MHTKKKSTYIIVLSFTLLLSFFLAIPVEAADNFVVTVEQNGKLTSNQKLIFSEENIGPGFSNEYKVDFVNHYKEKVTIYIEKISVKTTAPTTEHFRFAFKGGNVTLSGGIKDFKTKSSAVLTVPANSTGTINVGFELLSSGGNEYQDATSKFFITFRVKSKDSNGIIDGNGDSVATGDASNTVLWIGILLVSLFLLLLVLGSKKVFKRREVSRASKLKKKISSIFSTVFLILAVFILVITFIFVFTGKGDRFLFGYKPFIVATGSMEPEYLTHSVVIIQKDAYEDVEVGDVIAFTPEQLDGQGAMHRVIEKNSEGYITKGDNNSYADEGYVTPQNYVGRTIWHTNALTGYIDKLLQPNGIILFLVVPLAGILLLIAAVNILFSAKQSYVEQTEDIVDNEENKEN